MTGDVGNRDDDTAMGRYLARCRRRFKWVARLRIAAAGFTVLAVATVCLAAMAAYVVPSEGWIVAARVLLYGIGVATIVACVVRRIGARRTARQVERRVTAFDGRLITWLDASRRPRRPALLPHLAGHAIEVAEEHPPRRAAPTWLLLPPLAVLAAAALALYLTYDAAPASWRLPAERLWTGDLLADTRPKIIVEPGDVVVPRGADVLLRARAHGFAADLLAVNASFAGSGSWERATMLPASQDGTHEFVLVAVNEAVEYYVSAGGARDGRLNSDRFRIEVADLPVVESVELALDYPAWTGLEGTTQDHGDVAGVEGTRVGARILASLPLDDAHLAVNDRELDLDDGVGTFAVEAPGTWHVAVRHRGEVVRISDEYLIDLLHDRPPEVEFAFPGRDRSATAIEEVALRFSAKDDFGVEALTVRYAVNGSDWTSVEGDATTVDREADASHTIFLEDVAVGEEQRPIRPGDVVAVHAVARDHRQSTKTALYFVDVRAFDKRYRDMGTNSAGNGGDGGGGREQELSNRQREIVNATWNLIQERDTGARAGSDLKDQMDLVGVLQRTLMEQVETLVARAQGRRLSVNDEVEPYVAELGLAAAQMEIAADTIASHLLDDAVQPEQRALQHLLTAEAGLRDVNVTLSSSNSAGDTVSRSLSELFDLETDPEQNRYESPQTPGGSARASQEVESEWRRLTELARRSEELARAHEQPSRPEAPLSRWQLERLKRELEELREQLANDSNSSSQQANRQPSGGQPETRASGRPAAGGTPSGANPPPDIRGTLADLERARQAIERSLGAENAELASGAAAEAFRQGADALQRAADQLLKDQRDSLGAGLRDAHRRAEALLAEQERILKRLQALSDEVVEAYRQGRSYTYRGSDFDEEAQTKRRMREDVERIAADVSDLRQQLAQSTDEDAELTRLLDRALDDLTDSRVVDQLTMAADYLEMGRPLFIARRERPVHDALNRLSNRLANAVERFESANADSASPTTVADVQALRRRLTAVGPGGDPRALREVADAAWDLAAEVIGAQGVLDLAETRQTYRGLGASDANRERLYRLTLAELDQMEIALRKVDGAPVRAEEREEGYDSEAVAEYFRQLSAGG
ncbi:MAG: hypothetical protein OXU77_22370 [Gammaproteobacteria bacterium]|nr:hypothetical protein [Gammaproteobacteria bacterium]